MVPVSVAFLFVWGNGVVDECLDAGVGQAALEFVSTRGKDWKNMEYVLFGGAVEIREEDVC